MEFILADLFTVDGPKFIDGQLIIIVNIKSKIVGFPYEGKFEQVDYNVTLNLPNALPTEIEAQIPILAQAWITATYPTT